MAHHKKKSKKRHPHRRRRMSGVHPALAQTGMLLAGAAIGGIVAPFVNQGIKSAFKALPPAAVGVGMAAVGAIAPMFLKPSPLVMGAAAGFAAMGLVFAANESFISLPGISGIPMGISNAAGRPGYVNRVVGYSPKLVKNTVGNFSGNTRRTVAGILYN